ncbi:hypothetical protein [Specibacter sp. NPDC078709]|uniref:hypothetical protein n=1 Tax=unclassified Specibacter TaxID=3081321 RepID=UPI003427569F
MAVVTRFVSVVELTEGANSQGVSVSVLLEAELANGRSLVVLDDRGWNSNQPWDQARPEQIRETARTVVGPDEPYGEQTMADAVTAYWDYIRRILAEYGIESRSTELQAIPHEVVLSERVLERLKHRADG